MNKQISIILYCCIWQKKNTDKTIGTYHSGLINDVFELTQIIDIDLAEHELLESDSGIIIDVYMFILIPYNKPELIPYKTSVTDLIKLKIGTAGCLQFVLLDNVGFPSDGDVQHLSNQTSFVFKKSQNLIKLKLQLAY